MASPIVSAALPNQISAEDTLWVHQIPADAFSDADGDTLTFIATLSDSSPLPEWLGFDPVTRTFSGIPPLNFNGDLNLTVVASDGTTIVSDTFVLSVTAVNDAPVVSTALVNLAILENAPWIYQIPSSAFVDVDGDALIYSATLEGGTGLPSWLNFDAATRTFSGTPPTNFLGNIPLTVTASDGNLSVSDTFTLTVTDVLGQLIDGTAGNDILNGTAGGDTINGFIGNDTINGNAGNDVIDGGAGYDFVDGGNGDDTISDSIEGGFLFGGDGNDKIDLNGNGTANGGNGDDMVNLTGSGAADGGEGNDTINLIGGGNVYGRGGNDTINAGSGDIYIDTGSGNDIVNSGTGNDIVYSWGSGSDTIRTGAGNDTVQTNKSAYNMSPPGGTSVVLPNTLIETGIGDDLVDYGNVGTVSAVIDLGEGNDRFQLRNTTSGGTQLTLGSGRDTIELFTASIAAPLTITDFQAGPDGDSFNLSTLPIGQLIGWDGGTNPFGASGFLRLVQSGADTLLQIDRDGAANSYNYVTLAILQNVTAAQLDASNFGGFHPDGSPVLGQLIDGTAGNDILNGTAGGDTINGFIGNDTINGNAGNDVIDGGAGYDFVDGGNGDDTISDSIEGGFLFGGDGNDKIDLNGNGTANGGNGDDMVNLTGSGAADGGEGNDTINLIGGGNVYGRGGNDTINAGSGDIYIDTGSGNDIVNSGTGNDIVYSWGSGSDTIRTGAGNDTVQTNKSAYNMSPPGGTSVVLPNTLIETGIGDDLVDYGNVGTVSAVIDLGEGNDRFQLRNTTSGGTQLTLGSGRDTIELFTASIAAPLTITDFQAGPDGDSFNLSTLPIGQLIGWDGGTNPFGASGFLRLVQSGADTLLQIDRDGAANSYNYVTLAILQNVTAAQLDASNFGGFHPDGSPVLGQLIDGTAGNDILNGTAGGDTINGFIGNDTINGNAGNDVIDGGAGYDFVDGGNGDDTISDSIEGGFLFGGDGNDKIDLNGNGTANGGNGDDMVNLTGSGAADGGEGNDTINLIGGGNVYGRGGNDTINAGSGDIYIDTGSGNDIVNSGTGNDIVYSWGSGSDTIRTGAGNDTVQTNKSAYNMSPPGGTSVVLPNTLIETGIGDDLVDYGNVGTVSAVIDLGEGNDRFQLRNTTSGGTQLTLGSGRDTIELFTASIAAPLTITDFQAGPDGDSFNLSTLPIGQLIGWDGGTNPFGASGFLRLVQSGADTLLQIDRDGAANSYNYVTLAILQNVTAAQLDASNFGGFAPRNTVYLGTNDADQIIGSDRADVINSNAGNDSLTGGSGNDALDGGTGIDIAYYSGAIGDYTITPNADGSITVADTRVGSPDGVDTLRNVELLSFAGIAYSLDGNPLIISINGGDNASVSISENTTTVTKVVASQLNATAALTYSISGGADASLFQIDASTGDLSFKTPPNFEIPADADGNNVYDVEVQVSGASLTDRQSISVTVTNANDAPVLSAPIADQASVEDLEWSYQIPADTFSDFDSATLTYSATLSNGSPLPQSLIFDPTTLRFSGTPPLNFNGDLSITVTASDGIATASDTFILQVSAVNDAPVVSTAIADQTSLENEEWRFQIPANAFSDVDSNTLYFSALLDDGSALPTWLTFDAAARTFSGTPPLDYLGTLNITITASDGSASVTDTFAISIIFNVNDAPVVSLPIPNRVILENAPWSYQVPAATFSDVDRDVLTYSATLDNGSPLPVWLTFDSATRTFSGTPPTNSIGDISLKVIASDGALTSSDTFILTVTDVLGQLIDGTAGNDTLNGTAGGDTINGFDGNDTINGNAGNDIIDGGAGFDNINGGNGDDTISDSIEGGFLSGGDGNDKIDLNGTGTVYGGNGDDMVNLTGISSVYAGEGNDTITSGGSGNYIDTGGGNDIVDAGAGNDTVYSGYYSGSDTIRTGAGNDTIYSYKSAYNISHPNTLIETGTGDDLVDYGNTGTVSAVIDLGEGNDRLQLRNAVSGGTQLTLGGGRDAIELYNVSIAAPLTITDFQAGPDGDSFNLFTLPAGQLFGWDGGTNPFGASGFLRLVQSGADTLLQVDRDGAANSMAPMPGMAIGFVTLAILQNVTASQLDASNFGGFHPDGSPVLGQLIDGTAGNDTLNGTAGGDTINGFDGNDTINGNAGNDIIDGGAGFDNINGGNGDDTISDSIEGGFLSGGDGNDKIDLNGTGTVYGGNGDDMVNLTGISSVYAGEGNDTITSGGSGNYIDTGGGNDIVDAGAGNDTVYSGYYSGSDTIRTGAGNDTIYSYKSAYNISHPNTLIETGTGDDLVDYGNTGTVSAVIDLGEGNDRLQLRNAVSGGTQLTLGGGRDAIELYNVSIAAPLTITDFQAGPDGDSFNLFTLPAGQLFGWDGGTNPFGASGFLRLVQSGADTLLQVDRDGAANSMAPMPGMAIGFVTLAILQNVTASQLDASNFGGFHPDGSPVLGQLIDGTAGNDTLNGTAGGDTINGFDGNDTINGNAGNDIIDGGAGFDNINGGNGDDTISDSIEGGFLSGGDGNDKIDLNGTGTVYGGNGDDMVNLTGISSVYAGEGNDTITSGGSGNYIDTGGGNDIVDAGAGNDTVYSGYYSGSDTIRTGAGNDTIYSYKSAYNISHPNTLIETGTGDDLVDYGNTGTVSAVIDLGEGNDRLQLRNAVSGGTQLTLGGGRDAIELYNVSIAAPLTITDFQAGPDGDSFNLFTLPAGQLFGWDGGTNPFGASGFLRLVQSGADTLLQVDRDGAANSMAPMPGMAIGFVTLAILQNVTASQLDASNFGGFAPRGITYLGSADADQFVGTTRDDVFTALAGNDTLTGTGGNDRIDGGDGIDTAVYDGSRGDYTVTTNVDGSISVTDNRASNPNGTDTLIAVERLNIGGTLYALDGKPLITSNGGVDAAALSVVENSTFVTQVIATSLNANASLVYSITGGADAALFQIDPATGELRFKNAPDFETPADAGANNAYDVEVQVSDGSNVDVQSIAVSITNANEAPTITSSGILLRSSSAGIVDVPYHYIPGQGISINGHTYIATNLSYTVGDDISGTIAAQFGTGARLASWENLVTDLTSSPLVANFLNSLALPVETPYGSYPNLYVSYNGAEQDGARGRWFVSNFTDSSPGAVGYAAFGELFSQLYLGSFGWSGQALIRIDNAALSVSTTPENITASTAVYMASAIDPDAGSTLSYSIAGGADAALFNIDSATGAITFKTSPNYELPSDADGNNIYLLTIQVSDGELTDTQSVAINVTDVNDAILVPGSIPDQSINEDNAWSYQLPADTFSAVNADTFSFSATLSNGAPLPAWMSFDPATRTFSGTPPLNFNGNISLTVTASDIDFRASDTFVLTIAPVNDSPVGLGALVDRPLVVGGVFTIAAPNFEFVLLADAAGKQGYASGAMSGDGSWVYTIQSIEPGFSGVTKVTTLEHTNAIVSYASDATQRLQTVQQEFGANATLADFNDVSQAYALAQTNLVNYLDLKEIDLPDIPDYAGMQFANEGPFVTYNGEIALPGGGGRAYFVSAHDGVVPPGWAAHAQVGQNTIDLGSWFFDRQILAKIDIPLSQVNLQSDATGFIENSTIYADLGTISDVDGLGPISWQWQRSNNGGTNWLDINGSIGVGYTLGAADVGNIVRAKGTYIDGQGTGETVFTSASATVANANRAPQVATAISNQSVYEDNAWSYQVPDGTFSDLDGDVLSYSATLSDGTPLHSWLTFDAATRTFTGTPPLNFNGDVALSVTASDGVLTTSDAFVLTVIPVNDAPAIVAPLPDVIKAVGKPFTFVLPEGAFIDPDGETLSYNVKLADGSPLPSWINYDPSTRTFSGTGVGVNQSLIQIAVTAVDQQTSVSDVFDLKFVASDVVNIQFDAGFDGASQLPFIDISVEMSANYDGSRGIEVWAGPINALKAYQVPFDPQTGLFHLRQTLPSYARDGEYIINAINAIDTSGRFISLVAGELPSHITDLSATVINPNADNIAPTLQSVALSSIAYTEQDIRITASVSVSDAGGSGIAADPAYLGMLNPSGRGFGAQIVYDDLLNGTATFVLSRFAASGTYRLQGINLTDNAGNPTQSNYAPIEFEITNPNQDIVPVTLANLKLSAFLDSVTNRPVIVKSGIASDALSGVDTVTVVLRSPSNVFYGSGEQLTLRSDGTTVDFAGQEALANNFAQGEYKVVRVDLADKADNLSQVAGEQLVTLGFDQSIRIFGPVNPALAQTVFGSAQADYVFGSNLTNDALVAGDGNDILDGGDGNDRLFGQAGDDTLYGGRGDDELVGDESHFTPDGGADLLYGGAGNDAMFGGSGNDTLYGEEGNDFLDGQEGNDILVGGVGDDTLDGGVGNDTLYGEEGNDGLYGLLGNDTLYGGIGNDRLFGQAGADTLYGGDGDDELTGDENFFPSDAGTDSLYGGAGNDRIYGYGGNDTLTGDDGNDTLDGGIGSDTLNGGRGDDTYIIDDAGDVVIEMIGGAGSRTLEYLPTINSTIDARDIDIQGQTFTAVDTGTLSKVELALQAWNDPDFNLELFVFEVVTDASGNSSAVNVQSINVDKNLINRAGIGGGETAATYGPILTAINVSSLGFDLEAGKKYGLAVRSDNPSDRSLGWISWYADNVGGYAGGSPFGTTSLAAPFRADRSDFDLVFRVEVIPNEGGNDTVQSSVAYTLGANLENLILTGLADINGTGNSLNNTIKGNSGNNTLDGGAGSDHLDGGAGIDTAVYDGSRSDYTITTNLDGSLSVADNRTGNPNGTDALVAVELLNIGGTLYALDGKPLITSNGGVDAAVLSVVENSTFVTRVVATSLNANASLVYSIAGGADAALFQIDPATGELSFRNAPDFEAPADAGTNNVYDVEVQVSDGTNVDVQSIAVSVTNINDAPVVAAAIADQSVNEDTAWSYTVPAGTFSDADGDTLTYTATLTGSALLPDWLEFDGATRTFSGTPPENFNGDVSLTVTASDGALSVSDTFVLTVNPVEDEATGTLVVAGTVAEGGVVTADLVATDVDGAIVGTSHQWQISANGVNGWTNLSGATTSSYTIASDQSEVGKYLRVVATTTDALGGTTEFTSAASAAIANVNDAPTVAALIADQSATEDAAFSFVVPAGSFADVDPGDVLTLSATLANGSPLPAWLSFNAATMTFSGTPLRGDVGSVSVRVTATDVGGLTVSDDFNLTVAPETIAPTATITDNVPGTAIGTVLYTVTFSEPVTGLAANDFVVTNGAIVSVAGSGQSYTVSVAPTANFEGSLALSLNAAAVLDKAGNVNAAVNAAAQPVDTRAPVLTTITPAADSIGVAVATNISLAYSEGVRAGAGIIELRTAAGVLVESFNVATSNRLSFTGSTLTIDPTASLNGATQYRLTVPQGAVLDVAGNAAAALATYAFTTQALVNIINGTAVANTLNGTAGDDEIYGFGGNDTLNGNAGNDLLDGGSGVDRMAGGAGNDIYVVDNAADAVTEAANAGIDLVRTTRNNYTLTANVENLTYIGDATFTGTGNALANRIEGGIGNDTLDGGAGADIMVGGIGNDRYTVDNVGDVVIEQASAGTDTVSASMSYVLGANVENLTLTGNGALNGTGNAVANIITGNNGANILRGAGGADTLNGGAGTDTALFEQAVANYAIDHSGTAIIVSDLVGSEGTDTLTAIETLSFLGSSYAVVTGANAANVINGGAGSQAIFGLGGNDTINGGAGNDIVIGGIGNDNISLASDTGGRDFIDGGAGEDTFTLLTAAGAENFVIYTRAAAQQAIAGLTINPNSEIVVTRNGAVIAELDNIEEIVVSSLRVTSPAGANGGTVAGDTVQVVGDFNQTSLNFNTITVNGTTASDTVDITGLQSEHRIVFTGNGGTDNVVGSLRPQDIFVTDSAAAATSGTSASLPALKQAAIISAEPVTDDASPQMHRLHHKEADDGMDSLTSLLRDMFDDSKSGSMFRHWDAIDKRQEAKIDDHPGLRHDAGEDDIKLYDDSWSDALIRRPDSWHAEFEHLM